jgi:hypothetical protein
MKRLIAIVVLAACGGSPKPAVVSNPTPPAPPVAPKDLTTAEQVIEASLAADGGRAAAEKITSVHTVGQMKLPQLGTPGKIETFATPPNNMLVHVEIPNLAKADQGVIGELVWEKNTMQGARVVTGVERTIQLRDATFNGDLIWQKLFPKAELKGIEKYADQDCYKIELTAVDGQVQTRYYSKDGFLLVGFETISPSQMGDMPVKVTNSDWRSEHGYKYPHTSKHEEAGQVFEITIDKVETNIAIPASTFEPPDDVKQLAAAAKK